MNKKHLLSGAISATLLLFTTASNAATISATIDGVNYGYTNYQSAFTISNITTDQVGFDISHGYVFCIDFTKESYYVDNGSQPVTNFAIEEDLDTIENSTTWEVYDNQNKDLAIAQLGWTIDNFFTTKVEQGSISSRSAFAQLIWEITSDGGTSNNLNYDTGNFTRNLEGDTKTEMDTMLQGLNSSGVTSDYVWQTTSWIVKEDNLDNQDYIILSSSFNSPTPVPEPTSLAFGAIAFIIASFRRKR